MTPAPADGDGPDWVRDALRQFRGEVVLFVRTVARFTLRPRQFAVEWVRGDFHALNPLGFLATALAVVGAGDLLYAHLTHSPDDQPESLARIVAAALLPFVYYVWLGALMHAVLRLFGSRRRWRDSAAMALYAGGGPASLAHLAMVLLVAIRFLVTGSRDVDGLRSLGDWLLVAGATAVFTLFCTTLGMALGALHTRVRWYHVLVANLFAIVVSAFMFGILHPPGKYGLHFAVEVTREGHHFHFQFDLSD